MILSEPMYTLDTTVFHEATCICEVCQSSVVQKIIRILVETSSRIDDVNGAHVQIESRSLEWGFL